MATSDPGIGSSLHLFTEQFNYCTGGMYAALGLLLLGALLSLFIIKRYPDRHAAEKWGAFVVFGLIAIYVFTQMWLDKSKYERIYNHHHETVGVTLGKQRHKDKATVIFYQIKLNDGVYKGERVVRADIEVNKVIVPNGLYKVIYNSENPGESVIDFDVNLNAGK